MPRSKRDKKISLTNTEKKGLEHKKQFVEVIRQCVEDYKNIFMFNVENMRNNNLQDLRKEWSDSKFFFGKNKVMALALGTTKETEVADKLHKLAIKLKGQCGLLFTNKSSKYVKKWFQDFSVKEYARAGNTATYNVTLLEGPLPNFAHSIEPYLRQLGMPTKLEKGDVTLIKDHVVCEKGNILTPEQAKILRLLDHKMATFKFNLQCAWIKDKGFKKLNEKQNEMDVEGNDDD